MGPCDALDFFDAHCQLGLPAVPVDGARPFMDTTQELLSNMDGYGIRRALVWHLATRDAAVPAGNRLLAERLREAGDRLTGCWGFLPDAEGDGCAGESLFRAMRAANVRALRCWPDKNRFLLNGDTCGQTLGGMQERGIPLFLSVRAAAEWQMLSDLLRAYPRLHCVATDVGLWGVDRYVRPLFERYPHVCLETSEYQVAGGIAPIVERYGAGRLLFGSGFPAYHAGGGMLVIRHAPIPESVRRAIAGETLAVLLPAAQVG